MKPKGSSPHSKQPAARPYTELSIQSMPLSHFLKIHFTSIFLSTPWRKIKKKKNPLCFIWSPGLFLDDYSTALLCNVKGGEGECHQRLMMRPSWPILSYTCHESQARRLPGRASTHRTPKYEEMKKSSLIFELRRCSLSYKKSCFGVSTGLTESLSVLSCNHGYPGLTSLATMANSVTEITQLLQYGYYTM